MALPCPCVCAHVWVWVQFVPTDLEISQMSKPPVLKDPITIWWNGPCYYKFNSVTTARQNSKNHQYTVFSDTWIYPVPPPDILMVTNQLFYQNMTLTNHQRCEGCVLKTNCITLDYCRVTDTVWYGRFTVLKSVSASCSCLYDWTNTVTGFCWNVSKE